MTTEEIESLKVAARDRVALLDGEIPSELRVAWDTLSAELAELFPSEEDPHKFLALWLTTGVPAMPGIPSIVIRREGNVGVERCKTMLRRAAHGVYS